MELSPKQQAVDLIQKASKILVTTHINPDGDALGSLLATYLFLRKLGKEVTAVCADRLPPVFSFLPASDNILSEIKGLRDFIITIDLTNTKADKLSYNIENNKLNIIITPKGDGGFKEQDVNFSYGEYKYDLIIVLDAVDLERLAEIREKNPDLFYETPLLNIDHHPGNEDFGQVNLVDITATSTAEILFSVFEALDPKLIDEDIATCLLSGIITDTGSFQHSNTTPKSLTMAAQLVASGARQQEIIQHIYKTRPLTTLKLWGEALSKIKYDENSKIAFTSISLEDFEKAGASEEQTAGLIDELLTSVPEAQVILLLSEKEKGKINGSLRTKEGPDANALAKLFGGGGHREAAGFQIEGIDLKEAEEKILSQIKEFLASSGKTITETTVPKSPVPESPAPALDESQKEELEKEDTVKGKIEPGEEIDIKEPEEKEDTFKGTSPKTQISSENEMSEEEKEEFEKWLKKIRGEE